jgi:hypothetical protein
MASPRAYPLALAEKVLQEPSGLRTPYSDFAAVKAGAMMMLLPPTIAEVQSPRTMAMQASLTPMREAERAVRTVTLGPRRSSS